MRALLLVLFTLLFSVGNAIAADKEEAPPGPNLLRSNPAVSVYKVSHKNVPQYVEGALSQPVAKGSEVAASMTFFEENKGAFRMSDPSKELRLNRVDTDNLGMRHVRFEQRYNGLKVIGGELITHFRSSGELRTVAGNFAPEINLDTTPAVAGQDAVAAAGKDLASFFGVGNPGNPELVIFPWEGKYYLAWRIFLYSDTPMGRWEYFIDASSGTVIYKANRIMNANDVGTGIGVMGDTMYHVDTHYDGAKYLMIDYTRQLNNDPHGHDGRMPTGSSIYTNIAGAALPGSIASDVDNLWYDTAQAPAVSGHIFTAVMYDWLLSAFNRNGYNNSGSTMLTIVNYSAEGDNNAYWDGTRIVIWSWSTGWRSLAGCPDVIAHEWGHAVTEYGSNLIYEKESGAINESFSDMMGVAFEWAHDTLDNPDWEMGENGRLTGVGFRSMSNPHTYGDPDYYGRSDPYWYDVDGCTPSDGNDYCGVHTNCGVGNKWFYLLSDGGTHHDITVTGIGVANAIQIAYRANAYYWFSASNYENAALGTITAADDLDPTGVWATQVANAWAAVGVPVPRASLAFSYPSGRPSHLIPYQTTTFSAVVSGQLDGTPVSGSGQLHYSVNGAAYIVVPMTETSTNNYDATLPGLECGDKVRYYVSAQEVTNGIFYDPDTANPVLAMAASESEAVFSDNFETDKGWVVSGTVVAGAWERGTPVGLGERGDPPTDYDGSGQCFLTANTYGNSDIDDGTTILTSPTFDLSDSEALIHYARWYSNSFGNAPFSDTFKVYISNNDGSTWTVVESVGPEVQANGGWYVHDFWVTDLVTPTAHMKLRFEASDLGDPSVVEAGVDDVVITSYRCTDLPVIITASLPDWTAGVTYSQQLQATGGVGNLTWSDKNDNLSGTGLTLSSGGLLSGTPLTAGSISFMALVVDEAMSSAEKPFSFTINAALQITTTALADWTVGRPYSQSIIASGGTLPRSWIDKLSQLVGTGLSLSSNGTLTGTPVSAGSVSFTARVGDAVGGFAEKPFSFTINPAVVITTITLPDAMKDQQYSCQLLFSGGTGPMIWFDKNGDLAGYGLNLAQAGLLSGTPNQVGTISFTARIQDIAGSSDERLFDLLIKPSFICGDLNGDSSINILDIGYLINYLYKQGPAPEYLESADVDNSGAPNILDVAYLVSYLYRQGPAPNCP